MRMDPATTAGFLPEVFNMKFIVLERRGAWAECACGSSFGNAGLIWSEKSNQSKSMLRQLTGSGDEIRIIPSNCY